MWTNEARSPPATREPATEEADGTDRSGGGRARAPMPEPADIQALL